MHFFLAGKRRTGNRTYVVSGAADRPELAASVNSGAFLIEYAEGAVVEVVGPALTRPSSVGWTGSLTSCARDAVGTR